MRYTSVVVTGSAVQFDGTNYAELRELLGERGMVVAAQDQAHVYADGRWLVPMRVGWWLAVDDSSEFVHVISDDAFLRIYRPATG